MGGPSYHCLYTSMRGLSYFAIELYSQCKGFYTFLFPIYVIILSPFTYIFNGMPSYITIYLYLQWECHHTSPLNCNFNGKTITFIILCVLVIFTYHHFTLIGGPYTNLTLVFILLPYLLSFVLDPLSISFVHSHFTLSYHYIVYYSI